MDHDSRPGSSEYSINHFNDINLNMFQPPEFIPETDFETLISAIRGETTDPIQNFCSDHYQCNHFTNTCTDLPPLPLYSHHDAVLASGAGADLGGYDMMTDPNPGLIWNHEMEDIKVNEVFCDDSSEMANNDKQEATGQKTRGGAKGDRARTLISEGKRRNGMKEKLYELRSLVPNITKMDKASIVGDAALYIQDLQTESRNLRAEIATLETTKNLKMTSTETSKKVHVSDALKKITKLDMFQVEERGYYVRLTCNKGRGVAVSLHRALESITSFQVQNSNVSTVGDEFVLTFTLNVTVCRFDINMPNFKLWLSSAFINQGFEFNTFP
ncbi:transcription factor FER-LIKE IRON DEFICIENCY-INDUCED TRANSCRIPTION FACTOR-like [Bidens hawaiensis]|uniref:transcription factor FER-LIKE IRON DEFICIENCY-INDUCED TRANSCRIPTION FACTOR-like n=1 Tax=Bidens hawaiensis TaxID=980011 RepID=UPI00404A5AC5